MKIEVTFSEYLKMHFKRKYGNQEKAAEALRVSKAFLSNVVNGKKKPTKAILADAGVEVWYIITKKMKWRVVA